MKWQTLRMRGGGVHKQWLHHTEKYFTFLNYSNRHGAEKRSSSAKLLIKFIQHLQVGDGGGGGGGGKKTLYACTERLSGYNQKRIHFYNGLGW